jgi:two-component system, NtrC family, response regulator HydG
MTPRANRRILVVDDHAEMARLLADQLGDAGYDVEIAGGGRQALDAARARLFDVVLCDLRMKEIDGFDVLDRLHEQDPDLPVLIMTAFGAIESAVEAIKRGAFHYLTKPFQLGEVLLYVERALAHRKLRDENQALHKELGQLTATRMVGEGPAMRALLTRIARAAPSPAPVLLRGETGVGKELVARALHAQSRRTGPFVPVNCSALPEPLLESELFGHVRGAFTGATTTRRGLFVEADGGTLFLDEIAEVAPSLQVRLLRVLEDGSVRAVGADSPRATSVRIIAATHQDLEARIADNRFRADLFYRLNVVPIRVPALRERVEDIPGLVDHFLLRARQRNPHARVTSLSAELVAVLARAPWPGNVRELENIIERLVIVGQEPVAGVHDLEANAPGLLSATSPIADAKRDLVPLRQLESEYIAWVVNRCDGNKTRAAEILGIDVSTIHRRERERS